MESFIENIIGKAGKAIRHWWLLLVSGILTIAAGIVVFCFPAESYVTLSIMFGVLMLVNGVTELAVSISSRNYFMMRGYTIIGGVLDLILGIFLCAYPQITLALLPVILGIWIMYHSIMAIGFGADLNTFKVKGSGWAIAGGILLLVLSLLILIIPSIGAAAIVVLTGSALVFTGALMIAVSLRLRKIHNYFQYKDAEEIK